jgi:hypothetical protein
MHLEGQLASLGVADVVEVNANESIPEDNADAVGNAAGVSGPGFIECGPCRRIGLARFDTEAAALSPIQWFPPLAAFRLITPADPSSHSLEGIRDPSKADAERDRPADRKF